jgi:hypothetical protein
MKKERDFSVAIVGAQVWDPEADNLDVVVQFRDGRRYGATFFTAKNIEKLFRKNQQTGECAGGLYLWADHMILVRELSLNAIERTVESLLEDGEFKKAFSRVGS